MVIEPELAGAAAVRCSAGEVDSSGGTGDESSAGGKARHSRAGKGVTTAGGVEGKSGGLFRGEGGGEVHDHVAMSRSGREKEGDESGEGRHLADAEVLVVSVDWSRCMCVIRFVVVG